MKKTAILLCVLLLVLQTFPMSGGIKKAHAAMLGGGTPANPYIVMTPQDLSDIRNNLTASYKLGADIDLAGYDNGDHKGWLPIGNSSNFFKGTLEGNGYAIRNLTFDRPLETHLGLFAGILTPGTVNDIHMLDVDLKGFQYMGGIAGANSGTISNSYVTGNVTGSSAYIGGMAGFGAGSFQNSYAAVNVNGTSRVGGLVGDLANGGTVQNSYATGSVTGTSNVGGLAGNVAGGSPATSIQNSYATGDVTGTSAVGGLVGKISGDSTYIASIQGSYSTGIVTGSGSDIGGLVGLATSPSYITDSFWNTETSGQSTSAAGTGKTTDQMKMKSTYLDLDFDTVWGIREGQTYPYLLAFKPVLNVNPLTQVLYNLSSGQNELSVTGTVYDSSIGVQINVDYVIKDSLNTTVASATYNMNSNGSAQAIARIIPLAGLVSGGYTLTVSAAQSFNAPVVAAPLAFTIDADPPSVTFGTNGSWGQSASTTVTVNDSGSGVDASTLQYAWTQSTAVPAIGWANFSSADTLTKASGDGVWYLHVRAADMAGNVTDIVSNAFTIDNTAPTAAISSTASGTVNAAFPITITFSEPVTSFTAGGIVVGNGTVSNLTSVSASTYTATVTPALSGQWVTVQVVANAATDAAGNGNTASTMASFLYDTTKPTVAFGGFTANQVFSAPPSAVTVTVSEAVYWAAGGAPLTSANALALPLITMEKDGAAFSAYSVSYDEPSRAYTVTFNGTLGDGVYKVNVAGSTLKNAGNNTLDAASASFTVAVPAVTGISANPVSFTSAGGSVTVAITGLNLTGQTVSLFLDGAAAALANVTSPSSASGTVAIPSNATAGDQTHTITVYLNGVEVLGESAIVTVAGTAALSSNADLSSITLSAGTLNPVFAAATTAYTVQVSNIVSSITVTPTVADNSATVTVSEYNSSGALTLGPISLPSGTASPSLPLDLGENQIKLAVMAENGVLKTYTMTVTRDPVINMPSDNANLSGMSLSVEPLNPAFAAATTAYTMQVSSYVSSIIVTPTVADSTAIVTVNAYNNIGSLVLGPLTLTSASASPSIPLSVGSNRIDLTVTAQNGSAKTYTITVMRRGQNNSGSGGSTSSVIPPVIDSNGLSLDPAAIDTAKPSVTLEVTPKDGVALISIPATVLTGIEGKSAAFLIEIKSPYGSYQVPVNLASLIPGLQDLLANNNLKAEDISFNIVLTDKSGDKDILSSLSNGLPDGKVMGAIVDFHIGILNTKTGQQIGSADQFGKALTRIIPMPRNLSAIPVQWGAFRYNAAAKKFEFVAAKKVQIDGVWYMMISSYSNSVYVVAQNAVSYTDVQKHWSQSFVELAAAKGLVEGVGGGLYNPDQSVTRAEFAAMLVRALGRGTTASSMAAYDDVLQGAWYFDVVAKAKELGLLGFVKGSSFMPDQPLTREEMASMLAAAVALEKLPITKELVSLDGYKDVGSMGAAYLEDVRLMTKLQIMTGTDENTFSPKAETTRAQAAVVFIRTLQTLGLLDK